MKKQFFFLMLLAFSSLFIISCDDDDSADPVVANLVIADPIVEGNKATFSATAENAVSYSWNFGNGTTGTGASVETTYEMMGEYTVICTATGASSQLVDSVKVTILEGNPDIFNEVAKLLCGFDDETGESSAVWYWDALGTGTDTLPYRLSGGPKAFSWEREDSAMFSLFDPIDGSWWHENGPSVDVAYNDAYSFKLNQSFDYVCNQNGDGMVYNWGWANYRDGVVTSMYSDIATTSYPESGSWKLEVYDYADYADYDSIGNAPGTMVNGVKEEKAYYLKISGGAWLFQVNAVPEYQILSITEDMIHMRMPVGFPSDFETDPEKFTWIMPDWGDPAWLSPGEGEWAYAYLVKDETPAPAAE